VQKLLFLSAFLLTTLWAHPLSIGAGPYLQTQPYKGLSTTIVPSPVIFYDNHLFYIRWTRVGLYFMGHSGDTLSWGASLTAQPRANGYKAQKNSIVADMHERQSSFEGGLSLACSYKLTKNYALFAEALQLYDMLQRYNGAITRGEIGAKIYIHQWSFYPSLMAIYHSQNFNNYYFGVRHDETTPLRPYFHAQAGIDYAAQSYVNYAINKKYSLLLNIRADKLSKQVTDSPIVTQNEFYSGLLSFLYTW